MKWVSVKERLPESTKGFAKQIVMRMQFPTGNEQLRITTSNQLHDICKTLLDLDKLEWLDENNSEAERNKEDAIGFADFVSAGYQKFHNVYIKLSGNGQFENPYETNQPNFKIEQLYTEYELFKEPPPRPAQSI